MLVARTNPDAPKHRGISYFGIEMDQPGVDVRPLREMTGRAMFNEVFFDDARVSNDAVIGGLNEGWPVALTTLANERVGLGGGAGAVGGAPGRKGGMLQRRAGDVAAGGGRGGQGGMAAAFGGRGAGMMKMLAQAQGRADDPNIRQKVAELYTLGEISRYTQLRAKERLHFRTSPHCANTRTGRALNTSRSATSLASGLAASLYTVLAPQSTHRGSGIDHDRGHSPTTAVRHRAREPHAMARRRVRGDGWRWRRGWPLRLWFRVLLAPPLNHKGPPSPGGN